MAALYDRTIRTAEHRGLSDWRSEVLSRARGRILEIGAGTGLNLSHYPDAVEELVLTEPDPHMRRRLLRRAASTRRRLTIADADAELLPFASSAFDTVVMTLVLCTIPDVASALSEARRVLRPGGTLLFLEHVADVEGSRRLAWQRRLEPVWRHVAGNCHLTRRTVEAIAAAGFELEWLRQDDVPGLLSLGSPFVRGAAKVRGSSASDS